MTANERYEKAWDSFLPQFGIVQTTNPNCLHYFP